MDYHTHQRIRYATVSEGYLGLVSRYLTTRFKSLLKSTRTVHYNVGTVVLLTYSTLICYLL